MRTAEEARRFIADATWYWWQRFELVPGVQTPGQSDHIQTLLDRSRIPSDLSGLSVLDIGAANGAVAFEAERRGARRIIATDIESGTDFGLERIRDFLGSRVEFRKASIYDLPEILGGEQFDVVIFFGVLYHLRHPLLALDQVRRLLRPEGQVWIETAVCDAQFPDAEDRSFAAFFPGGELNDDPSNWFVPTVRCLLDWCTSSGLEADVLLRSPAIHPERCLLRGQPSPDPIPYRAISYERPVQVVVQGREAGSAGS
jgi:tRNA (mo5U34)-methyltransferase